MACTSNALVGAVCYTQKVKEEPVEMMSRLYLYWQERKARRTVKYDSGATITDGILALHKFGVCKESTWPYNVSKFTKKPTSKMNREAVNFKELDPENTGSVQQDLNIMKDILSNKTPITLGFRVFESFTSDSVANTGIVPMPSKTEKLLGGHAVVLAGYNDAVNGGAFLARNSWGLNWGTSFNGGKGGGYFWFPYEYVIRPDLATDFWTISKIGSAK